MNTFREILVARVRDMDSLINQIKAGKIAVALSWAEGVKTATEQALRELDKIAEEA
jgi:hypothetical protein